MYFVKFIKCLADLKKNLLLEFILKYLMSQLWLKIIFLKIRNILNQYFSYKNIK